MSREAMDQALLMQPYSYVVREEHMLNLRPRWGGSYGAMDRLAHDADSLGERNPRLRALHGFVDWDQGDVAERHKEPARALEFYDHALTFGDLWRFRLERGQLYERLGREDEALADLERALVQRPQHAELLDHLASTKYELARFAAGPERDRLFYESYGDESLAVLLDPAQDEYQESQAFYKKSIPEYAH
jgi:tetratricopeptide (TPR) repeat protein